MKTIKLRLIIRGSQVQALVGPQRNKESCERLRLSFDFFSLPFKQITPLITLSVPDTFAG